MSCLYLSPLWIVSNPYYIGETRQTMTRVNLGVDSCAAVLVVPKKLCSDYPIQKDAKTGQQYTVANGRRIPDLGQRTLRLHSEEETPRAIRTRVADVFRPLLAVYDLCKTGHRVVFDFEFDASGQLQRDNSHLFHKETSNSTALTLKNRTWDLGVDVLPYRPFGRPAHGL